MFIDCKLLEGGISISLDVHQVASVTEAAPEVARAVVKMTNGDEFPLVETKEVVMR